MRDGAEYFTAPAGAAQRRYEALRAYFLDEMPAAEVADRFGYSTASVHQMATLLRKGRLSLFAETRPGPKGPRKATGELRARVLELRAAGHSVTEIAAALTARGAAGLGADRLADPRRRGPAAAAPPRRGPPRPAGQARPGQGRRRCPAGRRGPVSLPCDHAGLLLLFPAISEVGLPDLVRAAGYPSTRELSSWQSIGTLLLAKCARKPRVYHAGTLADDEGLAFTLGLTALPKATHLGTYSWRVRRDSNQQAADRAGPGAAAARAGHRRGRVQLRLPRHPPPRRPGRPGKALRPPPLPAHPRRAHLLRPGPRHRRHGLRQRRHHQGRAGRRDHRLRRLLAARHRQRPRPAGLRLPAHHLQDPRRAVRPRHQLAHPAPARQDRARPPGRPARLAPGRPPSSPGPAATGGPACTKT